MAELLQKPVQEIAKGLKNQVPEDFIHKNGYTQAKVETLPWMDEVSIDFSILFDSSSSSEAELERVKLHSALSQWGCFQAINHGISSTLLDQVREVTEQFFHLPLEEKQKYAREIGDNNGYGHETIISKNQPLDWTDRLYLTTNPEENRKLKFWPENPPTFKRVLDEYSMRVRSIFEHLMKATARTMKLEENAFLKENGDSVKMVARFNYYPPCPYRDNVLGIKAHADASTITFLVQDKEVHGLQVVKDDQWYRVPIVADALFINVGDYLELMSNGVLKSPVHRVAIDSVKERKSLALTCFPDPGKEVRPIPELITEETPQVYRSIKDYDGIYYKHYQIGERPLHALRI